MNPEMMQLMARIKPQAFQPPPTNPILARLKPQIDQTTVAEEPQPTIYTTPIAEQESQVYTTPQAEEDSTRGRLITPPHDFEGDAQAEKDAIAKATEERDKLNQELAKPLTKITDGFDPTKEIDVENARRLADRLEREGGNDSDVSKLRLWLKNAIGKSQIDLEDLTQGEQ